MCQSAAVLFFLIATSTVLVVNHARASGFALQEQNGAGTGYAYAGAAAVAQDASTIFFNPAGMTYLAPGHQFSGALGVAVSSFKFKDAGSTALPGIPLGDNGGQAGGVAAIPAGYWSMSITPAVRVGLGLSPTFGSITDWSKTFVGRYQGTSSEITAINANPSIAWRMNNVISLGAGFNIVKFDADLRNMLPPIPGLISTDTATRLTGSDIGFGYNLGAMLQVTPATRLGITYRSTVSLHVDGHFQGFVGKFPTSASIKLPDTISVAISHKFTERLQLLADFTWTGWSSIPALVATGLVAGRNLPSENLGFKDSYRVGFGTQYQYSDNLRLKMGVAYDQSPVQNAMDRTVRLPDSNRVLLAVGFNQKITERTSVDVGYMHVFFAAAEIDRPTSNPLMLPVVRGSFSSTADVFSIQLNHAF
jgi:long-chain fatty acid transport protein